VKGRSQTIARRYAQALFAAARDASRALDEVRRELAFAVALLDHNELREVLGHPVLSIERKMEILQAIGALKGGSDLLSRLVELLLKRRRLELLPLIEKRFVALWNAERGVEEAEVLSARPLDPAQEKRLRQALEKVAGRAVEMRVSVDPAILGGALVRMGGRVLDGTVKSRLKALRAHLHGGMF
jgi:F-type H+-transporting ATPase subunit delta